MNIRQALAKRLRQEMTARKLTQYQVHKITGIPKSTVSSILKCETKTVKFDTIYELCSGLNIEFSEFFDEQYFKFENLDD